MRPTKMRNLQAAHQAVRGRRVCSPLSRDLRAKYGRRSVRVVEGDSVRVGRGAYRNVDGKVSGVDVRSGTVTLEGVQGEKQRGDRFDIKVHASNLRVTGLNGGDKKRMKRITGVEKALAASEPAQPRLAPGPGAEYERRADWPEADMDDLENPRDAPGPGGDPDKPAEAGESGESDPRDAPGPGGDPDKPAEAEPGGDLAGGEPRNAAGEKGG